jgi:hypothetical protein
LEEVEINKLSEPKIPLEKLTLSDLQKRGILDYYLYVMLLQLIKMV